MMKSNAFKEQVAMLISWFKNWSECEQTVAIYLLLKRSSPVQAKFLQQVLQHFLSDCNDVKELEEKANDEEYVRSLRSKEKGVLHQLLQLLPLLQVGKNSAKAAYLELIPDHLSHTILNGVNIEESRQLISFSLIHPALSAEERGPLHSWLLYLDDRLTHGNNSPNLGSNTSCSNRLTVGSSSSSSSGSGGSNNPSHSPSPVSPSHRSISQSSLCQDSNQDFNQIIANPNMLSPHVLSAHNRSTSHSPSPTINIWQQQQQIHNQPQGHSSGVDVNLNSQNFNSASSGNFGTSSLAIGSNGGSNVCHSPSTIASGQRSVSQTSLCQDLSQDQIQVSSSGVRPMSGHSPGPAMNLWQQQSNQQSFQHSLQGSQSTMEPSPTQHPSASNSDISGYGQYSGNGHRTLRATNSHVGTFEASRGHMPLKASASAPPNFSVSQPPPSKSQDKFTYSPVGQRDHARLSRTRSVVPPARLQQPPKATSSRQSSNKGSTDHAPLSPQSSVTSSESSDSHHEDGPPLKDVFMEECSGMKNLLIWLREMRLHKYAFLFRQMTYEELLNLSEEWLLQNNVTRGARQRFMINIEKLRERQSLLRTLEKSIMEGGSIILALYEMKAMLMTPIKAFMSEHIPDLSELHIPTSPSPCIPTDTQLSVTTNELTGPPDTSNSACTSPSSSSTLTLTTSSSSPSAVPSSSPSSSSPQSPSDDVAEGDLPSQFCRLLGKVCQQLLLATRPDEHCFQLYLQLIDKCLKHDAFTAEQKKSLLSRKQAAEKIWNPPPQRYKPNRSWWGGNTYPLYNSFGSRIIPRSNRAPVPGSYQQQQLQWRQQQQQRQHPHHGGHHQQQQHGGHQPWSSGGSSRSVGMGGHQAVTRNSSWNPAYLNKPGLIESAAKQPLSRTQSAPMNRPLTLPTHSGGDDTEINASLDSLCVRMTEQALP